jgi:hypothetical protein
MASSSRRVFIGYLVLAKAAKAGGDQTPISRPPQTAMPMIGNSGAPLEHLVHPAVCKTVGLEQSRLRVLEPTFFANGAGVGGVRERALGSPTRPPAHRGAWRRGAGRGSSAPPLHPPVDVDANANNNNNNDGVLVLGPRCVGCRLGWRGRRCRAVGGRGAWAQAQGAGPARD